MLDGFDVSWCFYVSYIHIYIYIYVYVLCLSFWMQMLLDKTPSLILRQHVMWNEQHKNNRHLRHPWVQTRSSPAIQTVPIGPLKVQSLGTCDTEKQNKTNEDIENINRSDAAQAKQVIQAIRISRCYWCFLCFRAFFMISSSLESLAVFLGASAVDRDVPSLGAVIHVAMSTKNVTDFSRLKMQLLRAPKDQRLWPQRPWRPLETKILNCFKIRQLSWGKSCLRWWKNMQAEQVARIWKQVWPNWPVSIWLMIDLMTAFHVTSCYIFPFLTRFGWVFVFHITVCLYYASVLHLAVTSWNSIARQQMTAG